MRSRGSSDTLFLISFFAIVICAGTFLLALPVSWIGSGPEPRALALVDALFVSTSAVCVTGLSTVNVADFSRFGQYVIMALIQVGGLGIISFTSLMLLLPGRRLPFRRLKTIRGFSVDAVESDPARIVRNIVLFTFAIESIGAAALYIVLSHAGTPDGLFAAVFHSVSAFCNAGFSLFPTSMERYNRNPAILGILAALIVSGGIGFIVIQDVERRIRGKRRALSYHSKLVLAATGFLILTGALAFWLLEKDGAFAGMGSLDRAANALFQSITPRTAGFNAVPQAALRQPSKLLTIILMFIGGAPGSIAGGIKVSTAYLVLLVVLKRANDRGERNSFKRRLSGATTGAAVTYFLKAGFLLAAAVGALSLIEGMRGADLGRIVFE
ncbi:MAG: potassium transporter TrkG, partial [Spirochaetaceae bacterium]|nr:potassium transporter TrkG [Spirochaetaceae bacterium]